MSKKKAEAIKALEDCDEFYLLTYTKEQKAGYWNFADYAKLVGCLEIAKEWFKKECLKMFK